jgi:hypothetical protein
MTQTIIVASDARSGKGAVGACGGVGPGKAAWIQAHDANFETWTKLVMKLSLVIILIQELKGSNRWSSFAREISKHRRRPRMPSENCQDLRTVAA